MSLVKTLYNCDSHFSQQLHPARGQKEYPRVLHMLLAYNLSQAIPRYYTLAEQHFFGDYSRLLFFTFLAMNNLGRYLSFHLSDYLGLLCSCNKRKNLRKYILDNTSSVQFKPLLLFKKKPFVGRREEWSRGAPPFSRDTFFCIFSLLFLFSMLRLWMDPVRVSTWET